MMGSAFHLLGIDVENVRLPYHSFDIDALSSNRYLLPPIPIWRDGHILKRNAPQD